MSTSQSQPAEYVRDVYCTACSVQFGDKKESVYHNLTITPGCLKPCRYKAKKCETDQPVVSTYTAVLNCPIKNKRICTFVKKSNAEELLGIKPKQ